MTGTKLHTKIAIAMILCVVSAFQNGHRSHRKNGPQVHRERISSGTAFPGACAIALVPMAVGPDCTSAAL
jgi:hypothetical protein